MEGIKKEKKSPHMKKLFNVIGKQQRKEAGMCGAMGWKCIDFPNIEQHKYRASNSSGFKKMTKMQTPRKDFIFYFLNISFKV